MSQWWAKWVHGPQNQLLGNTAIFSKHPSFILSLLHSSNLIAKMPMLKDPYVNQSTLQNVILTLRLPKFHKISSVSTHLSAKPPMAFQVNTEASEVVVY